MKIKHIKSLPKRIGTSLGGTYAVFPVWVDCCLQSWVNTAKLDQYFTWTPFLHFFYMDSPFLGIFAQFKEHEKVVRNQLHPAETRKQNLPLSVFNLPL